MVADLMVMPQAALRRQRVFEFQRGGTIPGGRFEVFEPPKPGHRYGAGADFALGLEGRDYDTLCILDLDTDPIEQVAEAEGHWGQDFDRILFPALTWYHHAFLVGEAQGGGLAVLQRLWRDYGYAWLYFNRGEGYRSRPVSQKLGYWRTAADPFLPNFRKAIIEKSILLRSRPLLRQMGRLQYRPRTSAVVPEEALDKHLDIKLAGGGSPDLVMAAVLAWAAVTERGKFDLPKPRFAPGSLGAILGHEEIEAEINASARGGKRR